tara:strand:+ start:3536 stop:5125 length:1590 start_codon:yes stop_codon:yes gene_type:complete
MGVKESLQEWADSVQAAADRHREKHLDPIKESMRAEAARIGEGVRESFDEQTGFATAAKKARRGENPFGVRISPPVEQGLINSGELGAHSLITGVGSFAYPFTIAPSKLSGWPIDEKLAEQIAASGEIVRDVLGARGLEEGGDSWEGVKNPRLDARHNVVYGSTRDRHGIAAGPGEYYSGQMASIDPTSFLGALQETNEYWKYLGDVLLGGGGTRKSAEIARRIADESVPFADDLLWAVTSRGKKGGPWGHPDKWAGRATGGPVHRLRNWPHAKQPWQMTKSELDAITSRWTPIPDDHTRVYRLEDAGVPQRKRNQGYKTGTHNIVSSNTVARDNSVNRWFAKGVPDNYYAGGGMMESANPVLRHYDMPTSELEQYLVKNIQDKFVHGGELHGKPILSSSTKKPIPRRGGAGKPEGMTDLEWNKHVMDEYLPLDRDYVNSLNAHRELTGQQPIPESMLRQSHGGLQGDDMLEAIIAGDNRYDAFFETGMSRAPAEEYILPRAAADERVLTHPIMSDTERRLRYLNPLGW